MLTAIRRTFPKVEHLADITVEQLNDFVVKLKKGGMAANTVLHNVIIIAQFSKRNGRPGSPGNCNCLSKPCLFPGFTRKRNWRSSLGACDTWELALFATFLMTGFREQEVMYLAWSDVSLQLRTMRVTPSPQLDSLRNDPKNAKIPLHAELAELLGPSSPPARRPVCLSFTGREPRTKHALDQCKAVAERRGLDPDEV